MLQITWTRLETITNPLTLLTVGDSDYSTDTRISLQPQKRKDVRFLFIVG
jgi:hypothetical protein